MFDRHGESVQTGVFFNFLEFEGIKTWEIQGLCIANVHHTLATVTTGEARHIFTNLPIAECCRLRSMAVFNTMEVACWRNLPCPALKPGICKSPALDGLVSEEVVFFMISVYNNELFLKLEMNAKISAVMRINDSVGTKTPTAADTSKKAVRKIAMLRR